MNGLKLFFKTILCCFLVSCASTKVRISNDCKIRVQYPDMVEENIIKIKDAGNFLYRGCDEFLSCFRVCRIIILMKCN